MSTPTRPDAADAVDAIADTMCKLSDQLDRFFEGKSGSVTRRFTAVWPGHIHLNTSLINQLKQLSRDLAEPAP